MWYCVQRTNIFITGNHRKPILNFEIDLFSRESLDRKLKNVHRRMAGKLCGPSSSKASPASTPIPLGTAKHKTLKWKKNTHTYTYTRTHIRIAYRYTRIPSTEISRAKKCSPSCKSIHSQANRNEGMARKETGKRVNAEAEERERKK